MPPHIWRVALGALFVVVVLQGANDPRVSRVESDEPGAASDAIVAFLDRHMQGQ